MDAKGGAVCPPYVVDELNRWIAAGCRPILQFRHPKVLEDIPAPTAKPMRGDGMRLIHKRKYVLTARGLKRMAEMRVPQFFLRFRYDLPIS